jgi:Domain of unknown function(DUF2779)
MSMYLTKSDFKVARTCATKLYYRKLRYPSMLEEDEYLQFLADGGYMIETIAKLCEPEGIEIGFHDGPEVAAEKTLSALNANERVTLFEATLISGGKLARVDILRKNGGRFSLIEVKAKSVDASTGENPFRGKKNGIRPAWRPYLEDVAFQFAVLRELFPENEIVPYLCLTDRSKTTTIEQIFSKFELIRPPVCEGQFQRPSVSYVGDLKALRHEPFVSVMNVAHEVAELLPEVEKASRDFVESLQNGLTKIPVQINVECRNCEYRFVSGGDAKQSDWDKEGFRECWGSLAAENPNVLDYYHVSSIGRNRGLVNALISRGNVRMADVDEADLAKADGTPGPISIRQRIQREYTLANREYFAPDLRHRLETLRYPLHFIDFETSRVVVPYHAGMHPYEQVAFQWSCHTIREKDGNLEHEEWINIVDAFPNFQFAEALMGQLGTAGTFLIWSNHENAVLNDIRRQMHNYGYCNQSLEDWLNAVVRFEGHDSIHMVDMCEMAKACYFHPKMKGRLSLKFVLPAVWETNETLHTRFDKYYGRTPNGRLLDPYETLPPLPFGNPEADEETDTDEVVTEGTGAMRAYQEMLYGLHRNDDATKEQWRRLLLQYCELDTAAMVMVWMHWNQFAPAV